MAAYVIKDAGIFLGTRDMTSILNNMSLNYQAELQDDTVFGDTSRSRIAGLLSAEANVSGFWDADADSDLFGGIAAGSPELLSFAPETGVVGDPAHFMNINQASYQQGAAVGEVYPFTLDMMSNARLISGQIFRGVATNVTADENSSVITLGAVAAGQSVYCGIHVVANSGDPGRTMDIALVSDNNSNFSSGSNSRISMTQVTTTKTSELKSLAGAITDTFWRLEITVGGDSGGGTILYTVFAVVGII